MDIRGIAGDGRFEYLIQSRHFDFPCFADEFYERIESSGNIISMSSFRTFINFDRMAGPPSRENISASVMAIKSLDSFM